MNKSIEVYRPEQLGDSEWRDIQGLQCTAFLDALPHRSVEEIDTLVGVDNFERFTMSHIDPNSEVGRRFAQDQSYSHPLVAVARYNERLVGYAYTANNVSGASEHERRMKALMPNKNYLWLREVSVHPDSQRQGVASALGATLMSRAFPWQPVSAYTWPNEVPYAQQALEEAGFVVTDKCKSVELFGEDSDLIDVVRLQAHSAAAVRKSLHDAGIRRA